MFSLFIFSIFLFPRHNNSRSLATKPQETGMTRGLALAEMAEIDHRVDRVFKA
jgi:hypothetical protein